MRLLISRLVCRALAAAAALVIFGAVGRYPGIGIRLLLTSGGGRHATRRRRLSGQLVTRSARPYRRRVAARHRTRPRRRANPRVPNNGETQMRMSRVSTSGGTS